MPNKVVTNIEVLLLHHMSRSDNFDMFVADHETMTRLIRAGCAATKGDLFDVIRRHH